MSQMSPDDYFTHNKGDADSLVSGDLSPFFGQFTSFFVARYSVLLGVRTKVSFLDPLSFYSTCILFHTRADLVVVFASAALTALLSEQICILLVMFLNKRNSVHLMIAITSC